MFKKLVILVFLIALIAIGISIYSTKNGEQAIGLNNNESEKSPESHETQFNLESVKAEKEIIMSSLTSASPNNKYIVYTTVEDLGFTNAKLWIINSDGTQKRLLDKQDLEDKDKKYSFFSGIVWKEDSSAFAYLKIWPTEIYSVNPQTLEKELLITKFDDKDNNLLNPSISKEGRSVLVWDGDEIIFENNQSIPEAKYSINVSSKKISKVSQGSLVDFVFSNTSFYSQRDDSWKDLILGGCENQTIGSAGCAVSSISMALKGFGFDLSPEELNSRLSENNFQGYVNGCDVKWYSIPNFVQGLTFKGSYDSVKGLERIDYELSNGNQVIMGFKKVPYTNLQHWVLVKEKRGNEYILTDPWETSSNEKTLKDFGGKFDYLVVYSSAN